MILCLQKHVVFLGLLRGWTTNEIIQATFVREGRVGRWRLIVWEGGMRLTIVLRN